jgi:HipA-like protein
MLPVYNAISFQRVLEKGGRTKPWLVLVNTGEGFAPYVVKLFDTALIAERDSVTNEVIGNVLAREFQLPVPDAALIRMDSDFERTVRDPDLLEVLRDRDDRVKFGTVQLEGTFRFDPQAFSLSEVRKMIEIDSVFAFDNLIRNPDRNRIKPNLLLRSNEAYLIDHELGLEITAGSIRELDDWDWSQRYYRYHIFYEYLKGSSLGLKRDYFEEFQEYLRLLNVNRLKPFYEQLGRHGFSHPKQALTVNYLTEMKGKSANFVNLLRGLIS